MVGDPEYPGKVDGRAVERRYHEEGHLDAGTGDHHARRPRPGDAHNLYRARAQGHGVGHQVWGDGRWDQGAPRGLVERLGGPPQESEEVDVPEVQQPKKQEEREQRPEGEHYHLRDQQDHPAVEVVRQHTCEEAEGDRRYAPDAHYEPEMDGGVGHGQDQQRPGHHVDPQSACVSDLAQPQVDEVPVGQ